MSPTTREKVNNLRQLINYDIMTSLRWTGIVSVFHIPLLFFTDERSYYFVSKVPLILLFLLAKRVFMYIRVGSEFNEIFPVLVSGVLSIAFFEVIIDNLIRLQFFWAGIGALIFSLFYVLGISLVRDNCYGEKEDSFFNEYCRGGINAW